MVENVLGVLENSLPDWSTSTNTVGIWGAQVSSAVWQEASVLPPSVVGDDPPLPVLPPELDDPPEPVLPPELGDPPEPVLPPELDPPEPLLPPELTEPPEPLLPPELDDPPEPLLPPELLFPPEPLEPPELCEPPEPVLPPEPVVVVFALAQLRSAPADKQTRIDLSAVALGDATRR
jgi:hypothetical protein